MFELLDDYYPAPNAAFFVCDGEARIIGCGRGSFELTGLKDEATLGRPVQEVLGPAVRQRGGPDRDLARMGRAGARPPVRVEAEGDLPAEATADVFPAYDEDGGLLLVLTPKP